MSNAAFIAGDWGTTHLRLSLCDAAGNVMATEDGPGIAQDAGATGVVWSTKLAELTVTWTAQHGDLPTMLCGMIGSSLGWLPVPYINCPTELGLIAQHMKSPANNVLIAPGLSCVNRHGAPDVMRGEETQIAGALELQPALKNGEQLLCLPGTHTKWVFMDNGVITGFVTAVTGELFNLVKQYSVLMTNDPDKSDEHDAVFKRAVLQGQQHAGASLLQLMFECRSRSLLQSPPLTSSAAYLSGLLIGEDVSSMLRMGVPALSTVTLIGAPQLTRLYAVACSMYSLRTHQIDGAQASRTGLTTFYFQHYGAAA